jgi:hypothetical protein
MCHFLGNKLYKVGNKLVKSRIATQTRQSSDSVIFIRLIEKSGADFVKIKLQFLGKNMLDKWFDRCIITSTDSSKVRVYSSCAFGK